jgi:dihydrofolate synthase / folylpolyglutamate synthase
VTIRNIDEANEVLATYVSPAAQLQLSRKDTKLERVRALMALIGNPQDQLRIVHIAGTSGKTSTAYYMTALLVAAGQQSGQHMNDFDDTDDDVNDVQASVIDQSVGQKAGFKVGLTVSPHIDSVAERVQINGQPLPEAEFCRELGEFLDIIDKAAERPSYFELLYGLALWSFVRHGCRYAVVETGVGGLRDATNVITRADKVCVITDIGLDHMHILGDTLAAITAQKIGIVQDGNQVFMYAQAAEIMQVVEQWTSQHQAPVQLVNERQEQQAYGDNLITLADYQARNWLLAYRVYQYLEQRDSLPRLARQVLQTTQQVQVPARMDIRQISGKTLVMDGAHNAQKMAAFVDSFQQLYPGIRPVVLLGLKDGKDYESVVPLLVPLASRIITTTFHTAQDLPAHAMDPVVLAEAFRAAGVTQVQSLPDQHQAFQAMLAAPETVCVITGSFYLLAQMRATNRELLENS